MKSPHLLLLTLFLFLSSICFAQDTGKVLLFNKSTFNLADVPMDTFVVMPKKTYNFLANHYSASEKLMVYQDSLTRRMNKEFSIARDIYMNMSEIRREQDLLMKEMSTTINELSMEAKNALDVGRQANDITSVNLAYLKSRNDLWKGMGIGLGIGIVGIIVVSATK